MSENNNDSVLLNTKRTRVDKDVKERDRLVVTFNQEQTEALIEALTALKGRQVNFDVRTEEKTGSRGKFLSSFVLIKEMIPKAAGATTQVVSKKRDFKDAASKISNAFGQG